MMIIKAWAASLACALLLGCAQAEAPGIAGAAPVASPASRSASLGETVPLLIQGYNYTDDVINSFTVNGQGGGRLYVSGPSSGGGGSVCCVSYRPGTPLLIKLSVRWVSGYCMERVKNPYPYGEPYRDHRRSLWREAEALAVDLSNGKPRALEVHIFPDGHAEAAITEGHSPPRLILLDNEKGERPGVQHNYARCTDDQLKNSGQ